MTKKTVYQTDEAGLLIGPTDATESPLEQGVFMIPRGCVEAAPPAVADGSRARWTGAAWIVEPIPEPPVEPPPPPLPRQVEIRIRLTEIDAESVRALRAVSIARSAAAPVPAFDRDKLAALEVEAAALRAELAALGA